MLGFPSIARLIIARNCLSGKSPSALVFFLNSNSSTGALCTTSSQRTKPLDVLNCKRVCLFSSSLVVKSPSNVKVYPLTLPSDKCEGVDKFHELKGKSKRPGRLCIPNRISRMIEIIIRVEDDMESKLNLLTPKLSVEIVTQIFQVLNCQKVSGLRFFRWVQVNNPKLSSSGECCSLIINNCGWIDDYNTLLFLLEEFKIEGICLSERAFGFLPVVGSSRASVVDSVGRMINMLNRVGGSCRSSGIFAMINMFCELDWFDVAEQVIEMTEKKTSYYHILIRQRCKRGHVKEVSGLIRKMIECDCEPTVQTYNYLLSSLSKRDNKCDTGQVLEEMKKNGIYPDAVTFGTLVHSYCKHGNLDLALQLMDKMITFGLEPRLQTLDVILKAFFKSKKYDAAHDYVVNICGRYKHFTSGIYSLLAGLHLRKGQLMKARNVIIEMMDKGNKPDSRVYMQIVRKLQTSCMKDSIEDLQNRYSSFC